MIDIQAVIATIAATWAVAMSAAVISLMIARSKKESDGDTIKDLKKSFVEMEKRVTVTMEKQEARVSSALHNQNMRQDNFFKTEIQELKSVLHNNKDGE